MAIERTLSIIKPDAVAKNVIGQIYARFEGAGLKVIAAKMVHLSRGEAEQFYGVHKERPFFKDLVDFMVSGPVMIQALEGENAILKNRELMGATDPKKAEKGTIRADFADSIDANAVHGSDAAVGEVGADRALLSLLGVGGAHQFAVLQDGVLAFQSLDHHGAGDHEVHQVLEERTLLVDAVELLGFAARQVHHLGSDDLQASAFEACVDLADHVLGNGVGLDDGKSAFDGHLNGS